MGNETPLSEKFLESRNTENGKVLRGSEVGIEEVES